MNLHAEISEQLIDEYGERLAALPQQSHDALTVSFDTGLTLQIRYANPAEYALHWSWQDHKLAIDTAPLHRDLDTFPNHLHDSQGNIAADPVTDPGKAPWENLRPLIDRLLTDALLMNAALGES